MPKTSRRKPTKRTAVVVLSMHRSGTSALTRVLSLLGCTLPQTLIAARKNDNATGFWESQAVVDVNEAICASTGSNWNDWVPLSQDWLLSPDHERFVDRASETLEDEFGSSQLFVLKDPRLCRLMPVWVEALERFKARPAYVLPVRNPFEVAASLRARNDLVEGDSHLAWLRHMLDAERYSRGQPRVFVRYDDLLGNWHEVVERISKKLDLTWPNQPIAAEDKINGFLNPELRHQYIEDAKIFEDAQHLPWIKQCYDVMSRWTRDDARDDDMETLKRINDEMNAVAPAFEGIVAEARALGKKGKELAKQLKVADAAVHKHREALEAARAERDQSKAKLTQLRDRFSQTDTELTQRRAELGKTTSELKVLRADISERDEKLQKLEAQRASEQEAARAELDQSEARQAQWRAELDKATSELKKLRADLAERDEQVQNLETRRASEQEEARLAIYQISQEAGNRLAEKELMLGSARREVEALHDRVSEQELAFGNARQEMKVLHDRASETEKELTRARAKLGHLQRGSTELATQAWSLLSDYMQRLNRETRHPGPRIFSRFDPLKRSRFRKSVEELRGSTYFDAEWYLARNADVAKAGLDPALHFIEYGFREGRAPSARFEKSQ